MKCFLCALFVFLSLQTTQAATISGTVDEVFCGEMDPFAVGDTCLMFVTTNENKKFGLNFDFDSWLNVFVDDGSLQGKTITAENCEKINDSNVINSLKDYNSSYFYMNCSVDFVTVK